MFKKILIFGLGAVIGAIANENKEAICNKAREVGKAARDKFNGCCGGCKEEQKSEEKDGFDEVK